MTKGWSVLRVWVLVFLVFLYAPAILLPVFAFNDSATIAFPLKGFTWEWFGVLLTNDSLQQSVRNSLFIAVTTAVLATTLGLLAARASARFSFPFKGGIMGFIMLPMVLPEIIVGVSLLVVILRMGLELSLWSIILGHVLICTPFCIAILTGAFNNMDASLEEASYDLGRSRFATFWLVTLPLAMPGVISSLLISFTISLDEFIIAFFLAGVEPTLPVYIWGQLRFPARLPALMALGTVMLVVSLMLLILAEYFRRRGAARTGQSDTGGFL